MVMQMMIVKIRIHRMVQTVSHWNCMKEATTLRGGKLQFIRNTRGGIKYLLNKKLILQPKCHMLPAAKLNKYTRSIYNNHW